jgi:coiled-coil domain-containing protein 63/114
MRNAKIIEDAFDQIKEATGIQNIEEIVTTFIKAEEQNTSLYNYVNLLNQETDAIEEQNKQLDIQISRMRQLQEQTESEKIARVAELKKRSEQLKD